MAKFVQRSVCLRGMGPFFSFACKTSRLSYGKVLNQRNALEGDFIIVIIICPSTKKRQLVAVVDDAVPTIISRGVNFFVVKCGGEFSHD